MTFISDRRKLLRNSALWAAALPALPATAAGIGQGPDGGRTSEAIFNVKDFGATGVKTDDARPAIQKAIDACSAAGGGLVYLPPGEYTSGTLILRSHIRFYLEAGATLYASQNEHDFTAKRSDMAALFFGENLADVSLEGRGTVNGQSEYEWREDNINDVFVKPAKDRMKALGKSTLRSFPKGYPARTVFPHLVWIGTSTNIRITGLSFVRSPSWTMTFHHCERLTVDGAFLYTELNTAVWADGIDLDGCKDVCIANCTIRTADDCVAIFCNNTWAPARPSENITITNCRLSSSSHAIKFTEGNVAGIRHVTVSNCVICDDSSGFGFGIADGGFIEDVIISGCTLNLRRFDWFWGQGGPMGFFIKRSSELNGAPIQKEGPFPGYIRNVMIRDLIIHAVGRAHINGHPDSWIDGLALENIKLFLRTDPAAPFDWTINAMEFQYATNLTLKDIEIHWEEPGLGTWQSALSFKNVQGLDIDGFKGRQAWPDRDVPAVVFEEVSDAIVRNSVPPQGTGVFLEVSGGTSSEISLFGNDFRKARTPYKLGEGVKSNAVTAVNNIEPSK